MGNTSSTRMMYVILHGLLLSYATLAAYTCPSTCQCYGTIEIAIKCNNKNLTEVPYISIPTPPAGVQQVWVNLDLSGNDITTLGPDTLGNLTFLRHLILSGNPISAVSHEWAGLASGHLLSLDVSYTNIVDNSIQIMVANLTALEIINLEGNELESVGFLASEAFGSVLSLNLRNNLIQSILEGQMSMLASLETLIISHNRLESVDSTALQPLDTNLQFLDLSNNFLDRRIISALNYLAKLEILYIGSNNITLTPADQSSWQLANLQQLNMSSNPVIYFPADLLSKMPNLKMLNLDSCSLPEFAINSTLPLRRLTMSNNSLTAFPNGLQFLTNLITVNLAHNLLETIPNQLKDSAVLPAMTDIDLSGNKFAYPSKKFIWTHLNLVHVTMRDGSLTAVAARTFYNSDQVRFLDLSFNKITFIGVEAFRGLTYGATVDLRNNLIVTLYLDIFDVSASLLTLNFESNPFDCDCRGNWMIDFKLNNDIQPAYCANKDALTILSRSNWGCPLDYIKAEPGSNSIASCPDGCICQSYGPYHQLNCQGSNLRTLASGFENLTKIFWVDYSNNSISQFPENWMIKSSDSITHLNLSLNQLTASIANLAIQHLSVLQTLDLSYNQISTLEEIDFSRTAMLEYLNVAGNAIFSLSANSLSGLHYLKTLLLNNNRIGVIDAASFTPFSSTLEKLDLSTNELSTSVWTPLNNLTGLTDLNMHTNNITELTAYLQQLDKLTSLDISRNPFESLPDNLLGYLSLATKVAVSGTGLESITVSKYSPLQILEARANNLMEIPAGIELLTELKRIDLSKNNISAVPPVLKDSSVLANLEDLDLSENHFLYPPKRFMQTHPNLTNINMSFGVMNYIGPQTFLYSSKARHINLSHNNIIDVNQQAFLGVTSGAVIDLSYNQLTTLYIDILPETITGLTLIFDHNPFICDCDSEWLLELTPENELKPSQCTNEHPINTQVTSWNILSGLSLCVTTTTVTTDAETTTISTIAPTNRDEPTTTSSTGAADSYTTTASRPTTNVTEITTTATTALATNRTFTNTVMTTTIKPVTNQTHTNIATATVIPETNRTYAINATIPTTRPNNTANSAITTSSADITTTAEITATRSSSPSSVIGDPSVGDGGNGCTTVGISVGYIFLGCFMAIVHLLLQIPTA